MTHEAEMTVSGIPVAVAWKENVKHLYLDVLPPDGRVSVRVPEGITEGSVRLFVIENLARVKKIRQEMQSQERWSPRAYVSGESYDLWGRRHLLQVHYGGGQYRVEKQAGRIVMTVPEGTPQETRARMMTEWYRKELRRVLPQVTARAEARTGIHADDYRIKQMKTKWGTCSISARRIWVNLQLAKKPVECLTYIVTHELIHLVEANHTERFTALLEKSCPGWREAKHLLSLLPLDAIEQED